MLVTILHVCVPLLFYLQGLTLTLDPYSGMQLNASPDLPRVQLIDTPVHSHPTHAACICANVSDAACPIHGVVSSCPVSVIQLVLYVVSGIV